MKELDNLSKFDPATLTPPNQPENSAQTPSVIRAESLTVGYDSRPILADLDLELERGQVTSLVGPNGSGKSTLLKGLARLLKPTGGTIYLDGQAIAHLPTVEVARRLAVLPQGPSAPPGLTVGELVEQGRYPHAGPLRMLRRQDHAAIAEALDLTGTTHFVQRPLDSLSGGEHQRAWIALALAQSTPILFLDEPTTFLDIGHQLEVLALIERLNRERQMTIVMVLHDLNQAARYSHRMIALREGRIVADGSPQSVLTAELLVEVFGVKAHIISDPATHKPVCLPYECVSYSSPYKV